MTNTDTHDASATIAQIRSLKAAGCDIVRITVPDLEAAETVRSIKEAVVDVPIVADIHFDYRIALKCAEYGIDKIRINPGNIGDDENVRAVCDACRTRGIPIRIREDAHVLFGFSTKQERELFLLLISVSGIGGNTARMILSALSPTELCNVISSGNERLLKGVKGIGLKTAQRIIVDLKDKIASTGVETVAGSAATLSPTHSEVYDEAIAALTMLGFAQAPSQKVVTAILKEEPNLTVEKVIKLALKRL